MKTSLNNFFWKKSDFEFDAELRALNELWYHVFTEERKLIKIAIPKNIVYFAKHKKLFLVKLLAYGAGIVLAAGVVLSIVLFFLNYFGIIDINVSKSKPKIENVLTVYLPDNDTVAQIECIKRHIKYNLIFLPDPYKNWKAFKKRFQNIETRGLSDAGSYYAQNTEYWGRYQLGKKAREVGNVKDITFKNFSSNADLQEGCFLAWIRFLKDQMQPEINRYANGNTYINGIQITESGIIALAHNVGVGDCRDFLRKNGTTISANGIPMAFLKIGGYNVSKIE